MTLQMTETNNVSTIKRQLEPAVIEKLISTNDIGQLTTEERISFYFGLCQELGLSPYTRPFEYIKLDGKLIFYATKNATDQLRKIQGISTTRIEKEIIGDMYVVTAYLQAKDGRQDISTGIVNIKGLTGNALANACMKAETKGKRRGTLGLGGIGIIDESEIETIKGAHVLTEKELSAIEVKSQIKKLQKQPVENFTPKVELELQVVLDKIAQCQTREELKDALITAGKSTLVDDKESRAKITAAKIKWFEEEKKREEEMALALSEEDVPY